MELSTRVRRTLPVPTIEVGGEIDLESGPRLVDVLRSMMRAQGSGLALDLAGVRFIDCAGLNALLAICRAAKLQGGSVQVIAVSPCVRRIIELTGLQQVLGPRPLAAITAAQFTDQNTAEAKTALRVPAQAGPGSRPRISMSRP